ncbi:ABC transporter ATP-binding protein [Candidatus Parabeggiatoa sp. HSG14]|uniref:ABC transporter ATP-binding protein n=1 Tax=Candidatus Parabeggiatoa sp. HSG14 TaxID=3055593 RepID=UPI0025A786BC|nr:ABC transporter ATP-binding protein [Thiotrichales bacterium HSG14]
MIIFEKVSKQFKRQQVLDNVTFQVKPGEHIALIGSNGAGKTTLMRCLLGEYRCEGAVTLDGLNPRTHRKTVLARIGFVPQLPPPLKMPVNQLIQFAAGVCGSDSKRIINITQQLGLDIQSILHRPFVKLSGGQKQKLLIAIALGRDTDILIMDEPAANLDPEARQIFLELLKEKQEHAITLISSHRLNELTTLVSRVLELDMGKVVLDGCITNHIGVNGEKNTL